MRVARILGEGEKFYNILSRIVDRWLILDDAEKVPFVPVPSTTLPLPT